MTCIHENEVNIMAQYNLLHDIINNSKRTKKLKIHHSPIWNGYINTQKDRANFNNFWILLYNGYSYKIVMGRLIKNIEEDSVMQCQMQVGSITTYINKEIDFTLPELSPTKIVTWNCHVDDSSKGIYDMILSRYLLTDL